MASLCRRAHNSRRWTGLAGVSSLSLLAPWVLLARAKATHRWAHFSKPMIGDMVMQRALSLSCNIAPLGSPIE